MSKQPRPVTNPTGSRYSDGPVRVLNETGGTLTRGTLVYLSGFDAASDLPNVVKADADAAGKEAQYVVLKDIANNGIGVVGKFLRLTGQNTDAASAAGDPVYLSATAGGWTATDPAAAGAITQIVGFVETKHASTGVVEFRIPPSPKAVGTNEIQDSAVTSAKIAAGTIVNSDINASAAIDRSKLATDTVFIDLEEKFKAADGADLALSETAGDFFRDVGTNQWQIKGEAAVNETEASVGLFTFVLPENYVAGGTITLRASALVDVAGDAVLNAASTIDMECRKVTKTTGAVGSDLVTTAATAIVAAGADYDFVVTPTGLVAGDKLTCKLTTSIVEDAGGTGAATAIITALGAVIQAKG